MRKKLVVQCLERFSTSAVWFTHSLKLASSRIFELSLFRRIIYFPCFQDFYADSGKALTTSERIIKKSFRLNNYSFRCWSQINENVFCNYVLHRFLHKKIMKLMKVLKTTYFCGVFSEALWEFCSVASLTFFSCLSWLQSTSSSLLWQLLWKNAR